MSHGQAAPKFDPATGPSPDTTSLTGAQLMAIMGAALLAAIIFLDIISG
jgi:hypothetical protein